MTNLILPTNKVLVAIGSKEETVNGFYVVESNRAENQKGFVTAYGKIEGMNIHENCTCIFKSDTGTVVDLSDIEVPERMQKDGWTFKVVDVEDILIVY